MISFNNQNYAIKDGNICIPLMIDGKSKRVSIPMILTEYQLRHLQYKRGSLRITEKSGKWMAQIAVDVPEEANDFYNTMGIDLGLKVPAVAVTNDEKVKFFGNGRKNKYMKRRYRTLRKKLGQSKKLKAIKKLNNKEQRWMKNEDHRVSRQIIDFAIQNKVSEIKVEQLANIRNTARTSRKNAKNLHSWSFHRLMSMISYKAKLVGIRVSFVDPRYTSQICPKCGFKNKAKDRNYGCGCGYRKHRDIVGALNIRNAPVISGKRKSA
jgi:IS605 OrfB family transposase